LPRLARAGYARKNGVSYHVRQTPLIPAQAGIQMGFAAFEGRRRIILCLRPLPEEPQEKDWIPACAGMSGVCGPA